MRLEGDPLDLIDEAAIEEDADKLWLETQTSSDNQIDGRCGCRSELDSVVLGKQPRLADVTSGK